LSEALRKRLPFRRPAAAGQRTFQLGIAGRLGISFAAVAVLAVVANLIVEGKVSVIAGSCGSSGASPGTGGYSTTCRRLPSLKYLPRRPFGRHFPALIRCSGRSIGSTMRLTAARMAMLSS